MIAVIVLVAVALLGAILMRQGRTQPLTLPERAYLCVSPVPVLMAFAVPAAIAFQSLQPESRSWSNWISNAGLWLSAGLTVAGAALLAWRWGRDDASERRLVAGVALASMPALLGLLVVLLYAILRFR
jgi:cytochrome bd-type quinol oxidase subunit 2